MILIDDNFATIVAAVEEGRVIYDNVRKFIKYLLSCNASEVLVMFLGPLCGMPLPLLPLQILWMNLVTDGLPALALGVEPAEEDVMRRPPHSSSESIFGRGTGPFILIAGVILSLASLGGVAFLSLASGEAWLPFVRDAENWQTFLFTTLVFSQMALALCVRSESNPLFRLRLSANPFLLLALLLVTVVLQLAVVYAAATGAVPHAAPQAMGTGCGVRHHRGGVRRRRGSREAVGEAGEVKAAPRWLAGAGRGARRRRSAQATSPAFTCRPAVRFTSTTRPSSFEPIDVSWTARIVPGAMATRIGGRKRIGRERVSHVLTAGQLGR